MFETILLVSGAVFLSGLAFLSILFLYRYAKYRYALHVAEGAGLFTKNEMGVRDAMRPIRAYLQIQEAHDSLRRLVNRPKPVATTCWRCQKEMRKIDEG